MCRWKFIYRWPNNIIFRSKKRTRCTNLFMFPYLLMKPWITNQPNIYFYNLHVHSTQNPKWKLQRTKKKKPPIYKSIIYYATIVYIFSNSFHARKEADKLHRLNRRSKKATPCHCFSSGIRCPLSEPNHRIFQNRVDNRAKGHPLFSGPRRQPGPSVHYSSRSLSRLTLSAINPRWQVDFGLWTCVMGPRLGDFFQSQFESITRLFGFFFDERFAVFFSVFM